MAKKLDSLTDGQQKRIIYQFQIEKLTVPEIQAFLWEKCEIKVTTRTIQSWFADHGISRRFLDSDMSDLKIRQIREKKQADASQLKTTKERLAMMIDDKMLSGAQIAELVTIADPEKFKQCWDDCVAKVVANKKR